MRPPSAGVGEDADETRKELLEVFWSVVPGGDAKVAKAGVTSAMFASALEDVTSEELRDVLIPKVISTVAEKSRGDIARRGRLFQDVAR